MSKEFYNVIEKINGLRTVLFRAHSSFRAFEMIQEMRAPNLIGENEARRNANSIGYFKGFVNIAEHSLSTEFFLALAKLYDNNKDCTSIPKLINYIRGNIKHLKIEDFIDYNHDHPDLNIRKEGYVGISSVDLDRQEQRISNFTKQIEKLREIINKRVAHLEIKLIEESYTKEEANDFIPSSTKIETLTYEEIDKLINNADEILNELSSLINKDVADYNDLKETVEQDSKQLIKLMRKYYDSTPNGMI